jgi:HEAT repeat protein
MSDPHKLVRSTCILILGDWQDKESLDQIVEFLTDDDCVIRFAAAEAVGSIGDSSKAEILEKLLTTIDDDNERVFFYFGLVLLGQTQWVTQILDSLNSNCYLTRCAAANSLISCVTEQNRAVILESLKQALAKEETRAAYSSIEGAIKTLEEET